MDWVRLYSDSFHVFRSRLRSIELEKIGPNPKLYASHEFMDSKRILIVFLY